MRKHARHWNSCLIHEEARCGKCTSVPGGEVEWLVIGLVGDEHNGEDLTRRKSSSFVGEALMYVERAGSGGVHKADFVEDSFCDVVVIADEYRFVVF